MLEGWYAEKILNSPEIRPYPVQPQETSGVSLGSEAIYRYALRESDYPTLIIPAPVTDNDGNIITPGYYELALSDEKDFLLLLQTKKPVAIIPVFKIEEDLSAAKKQKDKKYIKQQKKIQKEREKTNKKRAKAGMPPDVEEVPMDAAIEYVKEGGYYLIKYERGTIRAWGAIKG